MRFAIISPTAGLRKYSSLSETHLVLSHIEDTEYKKFYVERRERGDFIILDNGSYELGFPTVNTSDIKFWKPNVVVLPDFLLQPWKKTLHAAMAALDRVYDTFPCSEWMYVPQAEEDRFEDWMRSAIEALEDKRITWLGLPRVLITHIAKDPLVRINLARLFKTNNPTIKLWALGFGGSIHELYYLDRVGVEGIDTAAPVWRGWNGFDIRSDNWNGPPVNFDAEEGIGFARESLIKSNLEACGVDTFPR